MLFQKKAPGVTMIELLLTAAFASLIMLAIVNLMGKIYEGITSTKLKTQAYTIAAEKIDSVKSAGFNNIAVTPDELVGNYPAMESDGRFFETVTRSGKQFKIYKTIQYAEENIDHNLTAYNQSEGAPSNTKQIKITVQYKDKMTKTTELINFITNRELPVKGTTIEGTLTSSSPPPSLSGTNNPYVYVSNHPEYRTSARSSGSNVVYEIKNVFPGNYYIHAEASGFQDASYSSNPVAVNDTITEITGIDIALPPADTAALTGCAYRAEVTSLAATGTLTGFTSSWTDPENISSESTFEFASGNDYKTIYTDFNNITPTSDIQLPGQKILKVELNIVQKIITASAGAKIVVFILDDEDSNWASTWHIQPNNWSGTEPSAWIGDPDPDPINRYNEYDLTGLVSPDFQTLTFDITNLYNTGWTADKINSLGAALYADYPSADGTVNIAYMYLKVYYYNSGSSTGGYDTGWVSADDTLSTEAPVHHIGDDDPNNEYILDNVETETRTAYAYHKQTWSGLYTGKRSYIYLNPGQNETKTINFPLTPLESGNGVIQGAVIDTDTDSAIAAPVTVFFERSDGMTQTASSASFTKTLPNGSWTITASKPLYKMKSSAHAVLNNNLIQQKRVYLEPVGTIKGKIEMEAAPTPVSGINIRVETSVGSYAGETQTADNGYYEIQVPPGYYSLEPELEYTEYKCTYPAAGESSSCRHTDVQVSKGSTANNINFRLGISDKPVSGTLSITLPHATMSPKQDTLIIAQHANGPLSNPTPPHDAHKTTFTARKSYERTSRPSYSTYGSDDSTYNIMLPYDGSTTYDIYAYYTYISYTASGTRQILNYYKKISSVSPGNSSADFSGTWTQY